MANIGGNQTTNNNLGWGSLLAQGIEDTINTGFAIYDRYQQEKWNKQAQENWEKGYQLANDQFEYAKYANENAAQIHARDMSAAGLSPFADGTAGNFSAVGTPSSPSYASGGETPQLGIAQMLLEAKKIKQEKELAEEKMESDEYIAELKAKSEENIANAGNEATAQRQDKQLAQELTIALSKMSEAERHNQIMEALQSRGLSIQEAKNATEELLKNKELEQKSLELEFQRQKFEQAKYEFEQAKNIQEKELKLQEMEEERKKYETKQRILQDWIFGSVSAVTDIVKTGVGAYTGTAGLMQNNQRVRNDTQRTENDTERTRRYRANNGKIQYRDRNGNWR